MNRTQTLIHRLQQASRVGTLQALGTLQVMGERDWLREGKSSFHKRASLHHRRVLELYPKPKRMMKRFAKEPRDIWKGGAVYFILDRPIDSITHHSHILKIGETTRLSGRFDNYAMGHFYTGGVDTNVAVMRAMEGMRTDTCWVYFTAIAYSAEARDPLLGDTDWVPVTTKFYETKYTNMFRELSDGELPKGCKQ